MAHYGKGTFLIPVEENGQISDTEAKRRFAVSACFYGCAGISEVHERKTGQIGSCSGEKIAELLMEDVKGVVLNPLGVNVQLQVARRKRE